MEKLNVFPNGMVELAVKYSGHDEVLLIYPDSIVAIVLDNGEDYKITLSDGRDKTISLKQGEALLFKSFAKVKPKAKTTKKQV